MQLKVIRQQFKLNCNKVRIYYSSIEYNARLGDP